MKKVTTLGLVAITLAVNLIPMRTEAAGLNTNSQCSGGQKVITISGNCNLQDIQSQLQNAGVNVNSADWASSLNQQNCPNSTALQSYNTNISDVLGTQLEEEVKKATDQLTQQNCNLQTQIVGGQTDSTQDTDTPVVEDTQDTTTPETGTQEDTTTDTGNSNTDNSNTGNNSSTETNKDESTQTETTTKSFAQQVVDLVNVERAKEGLAALTIDENVAKAATVRSNEIQTKFDHVRPNGSGFVTALREQGVTYRGAGENIAWGQKTPQEVVTAWMNSAGHRANIMNPNYVHIGVGNTQNSAGTQYWVQIFTY